MSVEINFIFALAMAALLGALLGIERSIAGKHAGMRTYALVSMGSCMFVIVGTMASLQMNMFPGVNPLQIAANVVLGVGFLGTGLAVFRGEHPVELTTAAGLWVAAGVGMACGFGFYVLATGATVLGLTVLSLFVHLENSLRKNLSKPID